MKAAPNAASGFMDVDEIDADSKNIVPSSWLVRDKGARDERVSLHDRIKEAQERLTRLGRASSCHPLTGETGCGC